MNLHAIKFLRSLGRVAASLLALLGLLLAARQTADYFALLAFTAGVAAFVALARGHILVKLTAGALCLAVIVDAVIRTPAAAVPHLYIAFAVMAFVCLMGVVFASAPEAKHTEEPDQPSEGQAQKSLRQQRLSIASMLLFLWLCASVLYFRKGQGSVVSDTLIGGLFMFGAVYLMLGLATKRDPNTTRPLHETIRGLKVRAGKLDGSGDWDEAIAVYREIQQLGDKAAAANAERRIESIEAKKTAANG